MHHRLQPPGFRHFQRRRGQRVHDCCCQRLTVGQLSASTTAEATIRRRAPASHRRPGRGSEPYLQEVEYCADAWGDQRSNNAQDESIRSELVPRSTAACVRLTIGAIAKLSMLTRHKFSSLVTLGKP